jgi:exopolysaccharide biosynthesis polyprenyl glycosylphosphotransferase
MKNKIATHKKSFNNPGIMNLMFGFTDILITIVSYLLAFYITDRLIIESRDIKFVVDNANILLLIVPTWIILLKTSDLANVPRIRSTLSIFFHFLKFSVIGFFIIILLKYIFGFYLVSHYVLLTFSIINLFLLFSFRIFTYRVLKHFRSTGRNLSNVILYADEDSESIIEKIREHKEWGLRIIMIITNSEKIIQTYSTDLRIIPDKINIKNLLDVDIIDEVVYAKGNINKNQVDELVKVCKEVGVNFRFESELSPISSQNKIKNQEELDYFTFMNLPKNKVSFVWKNFTDFWLSFIILLFISPVMMLISLAIRLTSRGPVIFKQERVGLMGRKFYIYKFRTMVQNAEKLKAELEKHNESDGPTFKIKKDPRITSIGRILRKTGLDELPQLFNVLKGEMSLIGPRPPIPAEVEKYERWQLRRLSVKPGITCTWQIKPNRNDILFENWMKLDMQYIDNWSIKKDIELFYKTIKTIFIGTGY